MPFGVICDILFSQTTPITVAILRLSSFEVPDYSSEPLNADLNPICHLLALLAHHILHVSRVRAN